MHPENPTYGLKSSFTFNSWIGFMLYFLNFFNNVALIDHLTIIVFSSLAKGPNISL